MNNLALVLRIQGKYEEAEEMHRRALELKEKVLGPEHPSTLTSMNNLAVVLEGSRQARGCRGYVSTNAGAEGEGAGPQAPGHADKHEQPHGAA